MSKYDYESRPRPVGRPPKPKPITGDITKLLKLIPRHLFVNMVSKAGLPMAESRALCTAFKELKS